MPTSDNKRIAKNTIMLYFRMLLTMLVTIYTALIILNTFGIDINLETRNFVVRKIKTTIQKMKG